ncbi:hypothetical protein [Streptomyces sp. NPDC006463]|uniref:hypothetical protein n=1 Tax=Streptomyces sp. NPDC006463 TaxID=3364746 RepID=UPI00368C0AEC
MGPAAPGPGDLLPPALRHLPAQLEEADRPERLRVLDRVLPALLDRSPALAPEVAWAWHARTGPGAGCASRSRRR